MRYRVLARYGRLRYLSVFRTDLADLRAGEQVVLKTDRGTELGEVVRGSKVAQEERFTGAVLRRAGAGDKEKVRHLNEVEERAEYKSCLEAIRRHKLVMTLSDTEHLLGGEKIVFYFVAPQRVDFRELVRDLARQYHTRIEMRQIGVRDEARLLGDYEICGRELCCRCHLHDISPISIKMAKNQAITLDPSKLAGRCGRLKCCLRYEDSVYTQLKGCLPKRGTTVQTQAGSGRVVNTDVLGLSVTIAPDGSAERQTVRAADLKKDCNGCTLCQ